MMRQLIILSTFLFLMSPQVKALHTITPLQQAYEYYKNRENLEDIEAAKKIYLSLIKDKNQILAVRTEALHRYGRLSVFQGEVGRSLFNTTDKQAYNIFKQCVKVTDHLSPSKIGAQTPEYLYWRAMCISLSGPNISLAKMAIKLAAGWLKEAQSLIEIGQANFKTFEDYGFNRIQAGISIKSKFAKFVSLYDPEITLNLMNESLSQKTNIYIAYSLKAEAEIALEKLPEAKKTLKYGIKELKQRLENKEIPEDLIIENKIFLANMIDEFAKLN